MNEIWNNLIKSHVFDSVSVSHIINNNYYLISFIFYEEKIKKSHCSRVFLGVVNEQRPRLIGIFDRFSLEKWTNVSSCMIFIQFLPGLLIKELLQR